MQINYSQKLLTIVVACLALLFIPILNFGKDRLEGQVFLCCKLENHLTQELKSGYRAFIIDGYRFQNDDCQELYAFLQAEEREIVVLIFLKEMEFVVEMFDKDPLRKYLVLPEEFPKNVLSSDKEKDKRLFLFTPDDSHLSFSIKNTICEYRIPKTFPDKAESGFKGNPANDLLIYYADELSGLEVDSLHQNPMKLLDKFNSFTGKIPNFFVSRNKELFRDYHEQFGSQNWYSAHVVFNDKALSGVRWKELPEMVSHGKIHTRQVRLSPFKNGFHFTPDVFHFNHETSASTKIFYARPRDIRDEMVLYLNFDQKVENVAAREIQAPYSNVEYKKDATRGWAAWFNGRDSYIDFDRNIVFNENFTVSAWVNPASIKGNRSIIGKGKALSIKFRNGNMLFTSPDIMDHESDSVLVSENSWQHLCYVISNGQTVKFYKNGREVESQKAERIEHTEHSLLVGTNLWGESFNGLMDDLIIWNRNLSDQEIQKLYEQGIPEVEMNYRGYYILCIAGVAVFFLWYYFGFSQKRKKSSLNNNKLREVAMANKTTASAPSVEFFGGFKLVNRDGLELTLRFSPKRKQVFVLVLIKTLQEKGITSKQLTNYLWAGHSSASAKNNRSTQMQRIRETLSLNCGIHISYRDKKWVVDLEDEVYCDIANFFHLLNQVKTSLPRNVKLDRLDLLLKIIEKGVILPNMEDEWLDDFKSEISEELLATLLPLLESEQFKASPEWIVRLSRAMFIFDPLNELILAHQVKALVKMGKNTHANESLEHFEKVYQNCYDVPFGKSIVELLQ